MGMGCFKYKLPIDDLNADILLLENDTGFNKHSALVVENTVRRFTSGRKMNVNGIKKVVDALRLQSFEGYLVSPGFTEQFKVLQQYSMKRLMAFGVLNSKSKPYEKADSIWNAYDRNFDGYLPSAAVKKMIADIVNSSVVFVEPLFQGRIDDRSNQYLDNLRKRIPGFISNLEKDYSSDIFGKGTVTRDDFINLVGSDLFIASMYKPEFLREKIAEVPYNPPSLSGKNAFAALMNKGAK